MVHDSTLGPPASFNSACGGRPGPFLLLGRTQSISDNQGCDRAAFTSIRVCIAAGHSIWIPRDSDTAAAGAAFKPAPLGGPPGRARVSRPTGPRYRNPSLRRRRQIRKQFVASGPPKRHRAVLCSVSSYYMLPARIVLLARGDFSSVVLPMARGAGHPTSLAGCHCLRLFRFSLLLSCPFLSVPATALALTV